ncbi:LrgB family protein [Lacicoccus alkaliphilus]|uniref:TIGR00659 family protein n=1 Tax=Lacicoccus alkaliphilus DSM 16010 TaxID=1123231 RepID=A0A1M7F0P4_9BACL|nr:LrgB family protein [Salinicoccus alkaliphilus]SHL97605.1 TIGR00659 family protein [Salinicoccus alkaliphilus DSM 16010]
MSTLTGIFMIMLTAAVYRLSLYIHRKAESPWTLPILTSTVVIIAFLAFFKIPYDQYMIGGEWINELLGPAVVALAYPLYIHRRILVKLALPLLAGTAAGAFTGVVSGVSMAKWAGFGPEILYAVSAKSVTTPVAIVITESLGGITSLAAVMVMIAGIGGAIIHSYIFRLFGIHSHLGRGMGMGSASHAIGTAELMKDNQIEGSISTVAMVASAVLVSLITPLLVLWLV